MRPGGRRRLPGARARLSDAAPPSGRRGRALATRGRLSPDLGHVPCGPSGAIEPRRAADPSVLGWTEWVEAVNWDDATVDVSLSKEAVRNAPEFDSSAPLRATTRLGTTGISAGPATGNALRRSGAALGCGDAWWGWHDLPELGSDDREEVWRTEQTSSGHPLVAALATTRACAMRRPWPVRRVVSRIRPPGGGPGTSRARHRLHVVSRQ